MTSSLRKEILGTDGEEKAMKMIDDSKFTNSTKNSLKCLWRKKHNKSIYNKKPVVVVGDKVFSLPQSSGMKEISAELSIKIPQDICLKVGDASHLFVQKQLIHSQIQLLLSQEKAIDDMLYFAINEAAIQRCGTESGENIKKQN